MAGKNIEVRIAATGGAQAAEEIGSVQKATRELNNETKATAESSSQLDENVQAIARAQKAQVIGEIAARTHDLGAAMKATGADIREFDAEMGTALENAGAAMQLASEAASSMAQGFAVGGPLGAAVGGATVGLRLFKDATIDAARALAESEQASERAAEMGLRLIEAQRYGVDSVLAAADATERLNDITKTTTESIRDQLDALDARNRILAAEDRAKSAARDRQDAAEIASGADPEIVRAKRAEWDAGIQVSQINRAEEAKRSVVQEAFDSFRNAETQAARVRSDPNATESQAKNADEKVEELKKQFERVQADYEEIRQINRARRVEINERTSGRIETQQRQRTERIQRQKTEEESRAGRDAEGLIPRGVSNELRGSIQRVSKGLRDGDQGGELMELARLLNQLAEVVEKGPGSAQGEVRKEISALRRKVDVLEKRMRNA